MPETKAPRTPRVPGTFANLARVNAISMVSERVIRLHIFTQRQDGNGFDEQEVAFGPNGDGFDKDPYRFGALNAVREIFEAGSGQKFVRLETSQRSQTIYHRADHHAEWLKLQVQRSSAQE